jgi:hypothetical protein
MLVSLLLSLTAYSFPLWGTRRKNNLLKNEVQISFFLVKYHSRTFHYAYRTFKFFTIHKALCMSLYTFSTVLPKSLLVPWIQWLLVTGHFLSVPQHPHDHCLTLFMSTQISVTQRGLDWLTITFTYYYCFCNIKWIWILIEGGRCIWFCYW